MSEGRIEKADREQIEARLRETWDLPVVSVSREYMPEDTEGFLWRDGAGAVQGFVMWAVQGEAAEIVSVEALQQGMHIGGRLLDAAEDELRARGVWRITIVTTNDNLRALAFFVRRGYRLVRVHTDAMDRVRARKPQVLLTGAEGIPLRDMWELEKEL